MCNGVLGEGAEPAQICPALAPSIYEGEDAARPRTSGGGPALPPGPGRAQVWPPAALRGDAIRAPAMSSSAPEVSLSSCRSRGVPVTIRALRLGLPGQQLPSRHEARQRCRTPQHAGPLARGCVRARPGVAELQEARLTTGERGVTMD